MIEAAITAEQVADELQHMSAAEILDPLELVRRNGRLARRLREMASTIREIVSTGERPRNQATTRPRERRRAIAGRNGRCVVVESREARA